MTPRFAIGGRRAARGNLLFDAASRFCRNAAAELMKQLIARVNFGAAVASSC